MHELRFWTALVIMALALFTLSRAATLLQYGLAEITAEASTARDPLSHFVDDPAVGFLARAKLLEFTAGSTGEQRSDDLRNLLASTPLSAGAWLELARARQSNGVSQKNVVNALTMSKVAGPNEAWLMAQRAVFALPLQPFLPPEARKSQIKDLIGGWGTIEDRDRQVARGLLAVAQPELREEALAILLLSGVAGTRLAPALGLDHSVKTAP